VLEIPGFNVDEFGVYICIQADTLYNYIKTGKVPEYTDIEDDDGR